jgi:hypothetical protein
MTANEIPDLDKTSSIDLGQGQLPLSVRYRQLMACQDVLSRLTEDRVD